MKRYSVLCFGAPFDFTNIISVEVDAENPEDAKKRAVDLMKRNGHPNAVVAPDLGNPAMPVVAEIPPVTVKRYRVRCFLTCTEGESLSAVRVVAPDEASARRVALNLLREKGYPKAMIPPDVPGIFKMVEEINE